MVKAGEKARRMYMNDEAIGYLERAVGRTEGTEVSETQKRWRLEALSALAKVYWLTGKKDLAEDSARHAVRLGRELAIAPRALVRLLFYLCFAVDSNEEKIPLATEGLSLLGTDLQCTESALMHSTLAWAFYFSKGDSGKLREYTYRNCCFIDRLPYSEDLPTIYVSAMGALAMVKDVEQAVEVYEDIEHEALKHHSLRSLGNIYVCETAGITTPGRHK